MARRSRLADPDVAFSGALRAGRAVSLASLAWTVVAGVVAIAIGLSSGTGALVAFGAVGFVDGLGSATLAYHFNCGLRHERVSTRVEGIAHRIVSLGLIVVGSATAVINVARLASGSEGDGSLAGAALAAVSFAVLLLLSARKRSIAAEVSSRALRSDGHLSAVGATLAAVTIVGMATTKWLGWSSADATAAIAVGVVAVVIGLATADMLPQLVPDSRSGRLVGLGIVLTCAVAGVDALLGGRAVLIGVLIVGPACAAMSRRPLPTFAVSALAVALAVALGVPDGVWNTAEHHVFTGVVALVGAVDTVVVILVARGSRATHSAALPRMARSDGRNGRGGPT